MRCLDAIMSSFGRMQWTAASRLNAWMLMLLAVLAIFPRGSLHSCGRTDDHSRSEHHATISSVCPICDEALPLSTVPEANDTSEPSWTCLVHVLGLQLGQALGHVLHSADRGPPTLS